MATRILAAIPAGLTDTPAIDRAHELARNTPAEVLLYSAVYDRYLSTWQSGQTVDVEELRAKLVASEQDRLDTIKQDMQDVSADIETRAEWQHPIVAGIVAAAQQFEADYIIASSTRHHTVTRFVLSNTDWELLRQSPVPVLLAH